MKTPLIATLLVAGLIAAAVPVTTSADGADPSVVRTRQGRVSGVPGKLPGITVYKGIPFGAPPVGELRWQPPQPVAPWQGVRSGAKFGSVCVQPHQPGRTPNNRAVDMPDSPPMSEDCLYLNVWISGKPGRGHKPVMVWIFGGAYTEGAGSSDYNHGDTFAADGVVYVSFNYRVGALGFLAHPELTKESPHGASGNYALADVLAALRWVQDNIAAFGGDPRNVTIFGESAGAAISAALVGAPQARGLFRRSISQSGGWMGLNLAPMRSRASAEQQTVQAASALGAPTLAALRALPVDVAAEKLPKQGMIIDGWIIPEDLTNLFEAGRQNRVDILVGSNQDEGSFAYGFGPPMTLARWQQGASQRWGDAAELGAKAYPASNDAEAAAQNDRLFTDNLAWITRYFAARHRAIGERAWVYHFAHVPPTAPGVRSLGACHTCELPYVFDNLGVPRLFPDASSPELASKSAEDAQVARLMHQYWLNFARTGNPNGKGLPEWPAYGKDLSGPVLQITAKPVVADSLGADRIRLYQALFDRAFKSPR